MNGAVKYKYIAKAGLCFAAVSVACFAALTLLVIYGHAPEAPEVPEEGRVRALIVLGAGLNGSRVSPVLANRLYAAKQYADAHPRTVIVVSGGQGANEERSEASAMKEFLVEMGLAEDRIITEDKSTSTAENFAFSKAILDERFGDYGAAFATNGFHCLRAKMTANEAGFRDITVVAASSATDSLPFNCLREYFALLWQARWLVFTAAAFAAFGLRRRMGR